jgi:hypothetical protein
MIERITKVLTASGVLFALLALLLIFYAAMAHADGVEALPTRDGKILMSKHDFLLLVQMLAAQQKAIDAGTQRGDYWQGRYATAEECVREKLKAGKPVMTCFNDLEI